MDQSKKASKRRNRAGALSGGASLLVALDRAARVPLQRQIYASIRDAILSGRLAPDSRLPSSRLLAEELQVSRTTVVFAYEQLETEGYVRGSGSAGSFVTSFKTAIKNSATRASASPHKTNSIATDNHEKLARISSGLPLIRAEPLPFRLGEPALDLFPIQLWARLYARRARRSGVELLGYGDANGYAPLRAAIAAYVDSARGVNATADQVILTRGTQQAIHLAARALLNAGDSAWVEDPGYLTARALLGSSGATIVPVPVDNDGIVVQQGIQLSSHARVAYVSPSHQFPMGTTMSLTRRFELLEWAGRAGAWILEDDFDSEFRYVGAPIPSLQGLDTTHRVIYMGTFSKTVFPALRLGYVIVPPALVDVFRSALSPFDHMAPNLEQATLTEFMEKGHFTRHVRRMRNAYAARQDALIRGIKRELDGLMTALPAETGMHIVGYLKQPADDKRVSQSAWKLGVEAAPLSMYAAEQKVPPGLLLGFAAIRPMQIGPALRVLRKAITARSS